MSQKPKHREQASTAQAQRDQLDKARIENERYMRAHPELNEAIQEFVYAVLKRKPDNVRAFAVDFFTKPIADGS
jgi:hypothetical protein